MRHVIADAETGASSASNEALAKQLGLRARWAVWQDRFARSPGGGVDAFFTTPISGRCCRWAATSGGAITDLSWHADGARLPMTFFTANVKCELTRSRNGCRSLRAGSPLTRRARTKSEASCRRVSWRRRSEKDGQRLSPGHAAERHCCHRSFRLRLALAQAADCYSTASVDDVGGDF